jgi:periplasmic protein TonB
MFAGLESIREHTERRWTAMVSFTVQAALVAVGLVIPLLNPKSLPEALMPRRIFVPTPLGDVRTETSHSPGRPGGIFHPNAIVVNSSRFVFHQTQNTTDNEVTQAPPVGEWMGPGPGVDHTIESVLSRPVPQPVATIRPPRISAMMEGNLIHRVEPVYPSIARQVGVQGTVVIRAFISRSGMIERAEVVSGHPMLTHAAYDAVRQWKYRPYYLNGEPVEVETQVTVNFILNR